jgi:N-acetylneuraminate synthase
MSIKIVAEIGINHNGDMGICKELIDVAADSGANCVKFQKRDIRSSFQSGYLQAFIWI